MTAPTNVDFQAGTLITSDWLNGINDTVNPLPTSAGASTIGFNPTGTIVATNVQDAIEEITSPTGGENVGFTPYKNITSTNVSDAIKEEIDDLESSTGASLVGFLQGGTGTTPRSVQNKLRESVSAQDFGAIGDGTTVCDGAVTLAAAATAPNGILSFPFAVGSPNIYYFNVFPTTALAGIRIDVDPGVVLSIGNNNSIVGTAPGASALDFVRTTKFLCRDLSRYYDTSSHYHQPYAEKRLWLSDSDYDRRKVLPVNSTEFTPLKILWNTSDTWAADSFSGSSASSYAFAPTSDGMVHIGFRKVTPGDELYCALVQGSNPLSYFVVRHQNGYSGVYGSNDVAQSDITQFIKNTGSAMVSSSFATTPKGTHASYNFANSQVSIRIDSWNQYTVLMNGMALITRITPSPILDAGFGMLPTAGGQSIACNSLTRSIKSIPRGGRPLGVRIVGDSKACPRYDAWPTYMQEALEFSAGTRFPVIDNQAVAGASTGDMLATLTSVGAAGAAFVIISGGTNDIQGGIPLNTSVANISAMIDLCTAARAIPIVVVPSHWYTQTQSGPSGQPSLNYQNGGQLRAAIIRLCADKGAKVVNPTEYEGLVIANYINSSLTPNYVGLGDPVVYDNIHPTTTSNRLTGLMVAQAIMGSLYPYQTQMENAPVALTNVSNGWGITVEAPFYKVSASGRVSFTGVINAAAGVVRTDGTLALTLPANIGPGKTLRMLVASDQASVDGWVQISPLGLITIYRMATATYFDLSSLSWDLPTNQG